MPSLSAIRRTLATHGQDHLLRFWEELSAERRAALLEQIASLDFAELDRLIETFVRRAPVVELSRDLEPAPYYPRVAEPSDVLTDGEGGSITCDAAAARAAGEAIIRAGKIAAFTVAGGQGTRLGWNGPKGTYPATVVTGKPLFRCFAEQILAAERKYRVNIPWCIMTSPLNDSATRAFLADNNCFGLQRRNVFLFPQAVIPSMEMGTGRLLLEAKHVVAVNPDGHGGALKALRRSGVVEELMARSIEHISYFQVDNPLVQVVDPLFIGLHATAPDSSAQVSSKMVPKVAPEERVGVFARAGGRTLVIEYSDLPRDLAVARDGSGRLRFLAGSIAVHLFGVAFVAELTEDLDHFALPWHRAEKIVPHIDLETGAPVVPVKPNAVKLETFIFDALPLARSSIVLETDRVEEFAPIKNATGVDSPATSHQLQSDRHGRWLRRHRVDVPYDDQGRVAARIEISPLTALEPGDLVTVKLPKRIERGEEVVL